jgi:hypothetical protein
VNKHCAACQAPDGVTAIGIGPYLSDGFGKILVQGQLVRAVIRAARQGQGADLVDEHGRVVARIVPAK